MVMTTAPALDTFQHESLDFLDHARGRAVLADPMGARKTGTTLSWLARSHKGLTIVFKDETQKTTETFEHAGGIADFLGKMITERGKPPTAPQVFYFERAGEKGFRIEATLQWTESHEETIRS